MLRKCKKLHISHLHSLLRRLIWSVTKLCSRKETSGLLMAVSPSSLEEANSMTQWTKAKVNRSSLRALVWACCEQKQHNTVTCGILNNLLTSKYHQIVCLYLHQCIFRELWRVKSQATWWSGIHGFSLTISMASSMERAAVQQPGWVNVVRWTCI